MARAQLGGDLNLKLEIFVFGWVGCDSRLPPLCTTLAVTSESSPDDALSARRGPRCCCEEAAGDPLSRGVPGADPARSPRVTPAPPLLLVALVVLLLENPLTAAIFRIPPPVAALLAPRVGGVRRIWTSSVTSESSPESSSELDS